MDSKDSPDRPAGRDGTAGQPIPDLPGVASALPYAITTIAGLAASSPAEFVGEASFVITVDGVPTQVDGVGVLDGDGVRFYQKDEGFHGRDVRVWRVYAVAETEFVAEHAAAI